MGRLSPTTPLALAALLDTFGRMEGSSDGGFGVKELLGDGVGRDEGAQTAVVLRE